MEYNKEEYKFWKSLREMGDYHFYNMMKECKAEQYGEYDEEYGCYFTPEGDSFQSGSLSFEGWKKSANYELNKSEYTVEEYIEDEACDFDNSEETVPNYIGIKDKILKKRVDALYEALGGWDIEGYIFSMEKYRKMYDEHLATAGDKMLTPYEWSIKQYCEIKL